MLSFHAKRLISSQDISSVDSIRVLRIGISDARASLFHCVVPKSSNFEQFKWRNRPWTKATEDGMVRRKGFLLSDSLR